MGSLSMTSVETHLLCCGYTRADVAAFKRRFESCPDVWREFEKTALRLIGERKRAGAMDILGRVRWERVVENSLDFKVNNTDAPFYARIFAHKYPEHGQFFEFRKVGI